MASTMTNFYHHMGNTASTNPPPINSQNGITKPLSNNVLEKANKMKMRMVTAQDTRI